MARTNKYTSINFNHVLEKSHNGSDSNSNSISKSKQLNNNPNNVSARTEGRMLVLTRPTTKPITKITAPQDQNRREPERPRSEPALSDSISLRPQGRTGPDSLGFHPVTGAEKEKETVAGSPKSNKFVPPHLRPGFAGREERPGPEIVRPVRLGDEERPKSGGGYDRRMRMLGGAESDRGLLGRPRSSGGRPNSSG